MQFCACGNAPGTVELDCILQDKMSRLGRQGIQEALGRVISTSNKCTCAALAQMWPQVLYPVSLKSARYCILRPQSTQQLKYVLNCKQWVQSLKLNTGRGMPLNWGQESSALHKVNPWQKWTLISWSTIIVHVSLGLEFGNEGDCYMKVYDSGPE